jgi:hypothetical protein
MALCCDYVFEQDFEPNCLFDGFLLPSTSILESSTPLHITSSLRKIVGSLTETFPEILLFKTLPNYRFERVIPRLFIDMAQLANLEEE